jgi:hypothetical protein
MRISGYVKVRKEDVQRWRLVARYFTLQGKRLEAGVLRKAADRAMILAERRDALNQLAADVLSPRDFGVPADVEISPSCWAGEVS